MKVPDSSTAEAGEVRARLRGDTSADRISQLPDMHRRTLNRRLKGLDTTFQAILDEVRFDAPSHLPYLTDMPLTLVASSLDYDDLSAFNRAFRRWSGSTPRYYRSGNAELRLTAPAGG